MANELKTKFTFDADAGIRRIEETRANMLKLNNEFANFKAPTFANLKAPTDPLLKAVQNDIAKMQSVIISGEKAVTASIRHESKLQADLRISDENRVLRERKRIANEFIKSAGASGGGGGAGGFGASFGSRAFGSDLSGGNLAGFAGGLAGGAVVAGVAAVTDALKTGVSAWLDYSSKMEQARIGFKTMMGSADLADKHIKELQQFAKVTPFEFGELVDASRKLQGVGFTAKQVVPILKDVGNSLAAAGRIGELPFAIKALGDIQAKGKLAGQEIIQLANAGIPIRDVLARSLGVTQAQVIELSESGKISADIVFEALHKMSEEKFGNAMLEQSKTFQGAMSNIKDSLLITAETAFKPLFVELSKLSVNFADNLNAQKPGLEETFRAFGQTMGEAYRKGFGDKPRSWTDVFVDNVKNTFKGGVGSIGITTVLTKAAGDIGEGFAEGFFPKPKSIADLRKLDDAIGGFTATVEKVPSLGDKLKIETAVAEASKLLDITRRFELANAEQDFAIQKARRGLGGTTIGGIAEDSAAEIAILRKQLAISQKAASDQIKLLTPEEIKAGKGRDISATSFENTTRINTQIIIAGINAQKQINEEIEKGKKKVEELGKSFTATFDTLFVRANQNNPFALVFSEAQKSLDKLRIDVKDMKPDMAAVALEMERVFQANKLFETRLDTSLAANDLRDQASSFRDAFKEDLKKFNRDPAKGFADFTEFYLKKIEEATTDKFQKFGVDSTYGGSVRVDSRPFTGYAKVGGDIGGSVQFDLRNSLLQVFDQIATGGTVSRQRSFSDLGSFEKMKFLEESAQTDTGAATIQARLDKQLAIIAALGAGATPDQLAIANRKIISLTAGVDMRQLTGGQREGAALAREQEAVRLERTEAAAIDLRKKQLTSTQNIEAYLKTLSDVVGKGGIKALQDKLEITVNDQTSNGVQVKTQEPSNADTANYYGGLNFQPGSGGRTP